MSRKLGQVLFAIGFVTALARAGYAQTEAEPNNTPATANAIACGQTFTGSISPAADVDYYTFTLAAPSDLLMFTTASGTFNGDTLIDLIDADGVTIIETDDDSGDSLTSAIGRTAQAAGTYFVRVRPFSATATFNYTFTLLCPAFPAEVEPNGTIATATPADCATGGVTGEIVSTDTDYYSFSIGTTSFVKALCMTVPDDRPSTLILYDSAGVQVVTGTADTGADLGSRTTAVLAPGTYAWRVTTTTALSTRYHLTFSCEPCVSSEVEPNGTIATATPITLPASIDCASILPGTDVDYYTFTVASTVVFSARTGPSPSTPIPNTILAIFNSVPTLLASNDDCAGTGDRTSCLNNITLTAGTYHLRVTQTSTTNTYGYQLTASAVPCTTAEVEPNGTLATATPISLPATVDCAQISPAAEVDYYSFSVGVASTVTLTTAPTSGADTVMTLFDSGGVQLAENDDCPSPAGTYSCLTVILAPGTYFARIRAFSATAVFGYRLNGSAVPCTAAEAEPNNAFGTATALALPATIDCAQITPAADVDYYSFTIGTLSAVVATTTPTSGADTVMTLYDVTQTQIDLNDNCQSPSGTNSCIRRVLAPGTYYVRVNAFSATATFGYALSITASPCASGESEPNDTAATANLLAYPSSVECAFVWPGSDLDYYTFSIPCEQSVTLRTGPTGTASDTILTLYDSALTQLAENDDCAFPADFSSCITSTLPAGTYFVKVRPFSTIANFAYTFSVSGVDETAPMISCPSDITVECTNPGGEVVDFVVTAADDCDPSPSVSVSPASGSTFALGTTLVTATAMDAAGNSSMCTFNVIVQDTVAPSMTCPSDIMVECMNLGGEVVTFSASATDACDPSPGVSCSPPSGSTFPGGTTTVVCTATDASGNMASCSFDVTVEDTVPPTIACPDDVVVECSSPGGEPVFFTAAATDSCDPDPVVICTPVSGTVFPLGTTMVLCTATDTAGNASACTFDVTVIDTVAPTITCPDDILIGTESPAGTVVNFSVLSSDACDPSPDVSCSPASGSLFPPGTTPVSCTARDDSGNESSCDFFVTVVDHIACRAGNVNTGVGAAADVLFFNGSVGNASREVTIVTNTPVTITLVGPPSNPAGPAPFAVYAYRAVPTATTVRNNPFGIGVSCMPTPLTIAGPPNAKRIWNNTGRVELGAPNLPSIAAPSTILNRSQGIRNATSIFLQGYMEDAFAPNGDLAVTNGIVVHVVNP